MINLKLLLIQIAALQSHLQAVMSAIEMELGESQIELGPEIGSCPKCGAPPDKVVDSSTLAGPKTSRCMVCHEEWER